MPISTPWSHVDEDVIARCDRTLGPVAYVDVQRHLALVRGVPRRRRCDAFSLLKPSLRRDDKSVRAYRTFQRIAAQVNVQGRKSGFGILPVEQRVNQDVTTPLVVELCNTERTVPMVVLL